MFVKNPHFSGTAPAEFASDTKTLAALVLVGLLAFALALSRSRFSRGARRWRPARSPWTPRLVAGAPPRPADMSDPKRQMDAIASVDFELTRLLNREEARYLPALEAATRDAASGHRVMAQTSLGELIRPVPSSASPTVRNAAFASINSKRLDFAIFDQSGKLVLAIEYQGSGHYQSHSFMRDAIKREALRKAGVPLVEIIPSDAPDAIRTRIAKMLRAGPS